MTSCTNCGKANEPDAAFCSRCGSRLWAGRESRKVVTVLFADVVGSTELGERADPEAVRRVMTRWYEEMRAAIERHGGTVEKFAGDEVMAVFGVPVVREDDALRAVRAAADMRERLETLNEQLEATHGVRLEGRIGINTGEVVAGDPASGQTFVTGAAVNLARRLEQAAGAGEILIGKATYPLVKNAVKAGPLEAVAVKGKREPVGRLRVDTVDASTRGFARWLDKPMVGRERELRLLRDAFDRCATDRNCHLLTLLGPAGIGKSRLVDEFVGPLAEQADVLRGRCLPYGEGITFWPLAEIVRQAAGLRGDEPGSDARDRIAAVLVDNANPALIAERIAQLIGLREQAAGADEAFWAARTLFEAIAAERPLVLVFEEMERAEPGLLDLVEHVANVSRDQPILVVCVARPELLETRPGWGGGKLNATSVLLEPLDEHDSARLVAGLLGGELDHALSSLIVAAAEGNPLFTEEYAAMLVEDRLLERRDERWTATTDLAAVPMPPTIQALLASRIDQLSASERAVLERAAVEGRSFHSGAVLALSDEATRPEVGRCFTRLLRQELIRPERPQFAGEEGFRFRHLLIRDVAYESIPKERRAGLHERFAGWLEERAGDAPHEYDEIVGYHLQQAHRYRSELAPPDERARTLATRAAARLSSAGRRAERRGDWRAAVNLLSRAVALYGAGQARRDLLPTLIEAVCQSGDLHRAETLTADARREAVAEGDIRLEAWTLVWHNIVQHLVDRERTSDEVRAEAMRAVEVFERLGDHAGLFTAWELVADAHARAGRVSSSQAALARAIAEARRSGDERLEVRGETEMSSYLLHGPTPVDEAVVYHERALERARLHGDLWSAGFLLSRLARLHAARGQFAEAREFHSEARSLAEELGAGRIFHGTHLAFIEMLADDPIAAENALGPELAAFREKGESSIVAMQAALLGRVLCAQGRYDEAERLSRESEETAGRDDLVSQVGWRKLRARVFAARGALGPAESLAREAVTLAASGEYVETHADALVCLGEILRDKGRVEEAARCVGEAQRIYERKGNVVSAGKARALLEDLMPQPSPGGPSN